MCIRDSYSPIARYVAASGLAAVISISGFLTLNVDYPLMPLTLHDLENMRKGVEITFVGDVELET